MDLLQVLEGATYLAFIVGALVAVYELRAISRDRKTELMMRSWEIFCSHDFEVAAVNAVKTDFEPGKVSDVDAKSIADYFDFLGALAKKKLADRDLIGYMMGFEEMWDWMHPWIQYWEEKVGKDRFPNFEWMADEQRKKRSAEEKATAG